MMNDGENTAAPARSAGLTPSTVHHSSFCIHHFPRALLFDAVGTLIRPEPSVAAAYARAGLRHGVEIAEQEISQRFRRAMARQDEIDRTRHGGRTDQAREIERWRGIVADVFAPSPQVEPIFDDLWEHFASTANWRLFDDAADAWRRLAAAGVRLAIASNFDDRLERICAALPPLIDCPHVFVSSRIGWRKPHSEFFATIAAAMNLAPSDLLLVGDDLENDYQAATAAGWQAILLDRAGSRANAEVTGAAPAIPTIASLAELAFVQAQL